MRLEKYLITFLTFLAIMASATTTQAVVLRFEADGNLIGGGSVAGNFLFDTDTDTLSDISIVTEGTSTGGLTFTEFLGISIFTNSIILGQVGAGSGSQVAFSLSGISLPELANPGFVAFTGGGFAEFNCSSAANCASGAGGSVSNFFRRGFEGRPGGVTGAIPIPVPVPATLPLFGVALLSLAFLWRRERTKRGRDTYCSI